MKKLEEAGEDYRPLVLPDHPTPICMRTHTSDEVPYLLYDSTKPENHTWNYNEHEGRLSKNFEGIGYKLIDRFLQID